ncbi:MAG: MBL fold metallo-hydrolase [Planctomycetes bacterium]|nr:MBL fold metallo-hydrolase [Planctomycetota bacterium]
MLTFSLQSGSNGNAIYVEADGVSLLFDAGISGRQAELRLQQFGKDIRDVTALLISHDHADHIRCAGIYHRKFGLPVFVTPQTLARTPCTLGDISHVEHFFAGDVISFGLVRVYTIPTPHDAADGVAFVVESKGNRLGIFTDLGHLFPELIDWLSDVDGAYLESNYDPQMLAEGPYPPHLKQRIRGPHGHLSNAESARLAAQVGNERLRWLALAHLSEQNNCPSVALETHRRVHGGIVPLHVAGRYGPSEVFRL